MASNRRETRPALRPLMQAVDDICRYFFQTGKISDQSALGDEREHDVLGDLVRGDLCTGVAMLLQDGRAASWPFAHIWELCDGSRLKQVRINTLGEYSLAKAVKALSSSRLGGSKDMCFRALVVLGLNMGLLHTWLGVLASRRQVNAKVYDNGSLMRSPEALDTVFEQLSRLLTFPFRLEVEGELDSRAEPEPSDAYSCGGFLTPAPITRVEFDVVKDSSVFGNSDEKLIVGGAEEDCGTPWALVFATDGEHRALDLGRLIDVIALESADDEPPSFSIVFGPRTRTEIFACNEMSACVGALHELLWNFSLMRTPHLVQHREALRKRSVDTMRFFVHMAKHWYQNESDAAQTAELDSPVVSLPPPVSPLTFEVPKRFTTNEKSEKLEELESDDSTVLLTEERIRTIHAELPRRLQSRSLLLNYTTEQHGFSMTHFLQRNKDTGQTLLVMEDSQGHVFGAFASEHWRVESGFYGTGEMFLFRLHPDPKAFPWVPGSNNFYMQTQSVGMGLGGGAGGSGLWIDNAFKDGRSVPCATYANETLASAEEFVCIRLECWSFIRQPGMGLKSYG